MSSPLTETDNDSVRGKDLVWNFVVWIARPSHMCPGGKYREGGSSGKSDEFIHLDQLDSAEPEARFIDCS